MRAELIVVVTFNLLHQIVAPAPGPVKPTLRNNEITMSSLEDARELDKIFDEKLLMLSEAFRSNEMDPLKIKIGPVPKKLAINRFAVQNARHKSEAFKYIGEREKAAVLQKLSNSAADLAVTSPEDGPELEHAEDDSQKITIEMEADHSDLDPENPEARYIVPKGYNAELYGLSDFTRNQSVISRNSKSPTRGTIDVPFLVGPIRLIMLSPDSDDEIYATHAIAESIPAKMRFRRTNGSLKLIKVEMSKINAKTASVFLSQTDKFATRKEEADAGRLATHVTAELGRLLRGKRSPLFRQMSYTYSKFFNA
ncbi:uncharacterized protein LOC136025340 [Artemia franciscana]|uniref:Uncharacterized protein n=1 Tax=Artemia franciscana TaxID=6661 RepID=A0AA88HSX0_ARTSF|nr:hypothetical protein QYM36_011702 [Artemia franciscana]